MLLVNPNNSYPTPIQLKDVTFRSGFWAKRQSINRDKTIPSISKQLKATGRLDAWLQEPGRKPPKQHKVVHMFWDSDTGKWLEAIGYSLLTHPDPVLEAEADEVIALMEKAQHADGYLNTYFTVVEPENQWRNLRDWHEMYNAGHLIEGAVALVIARDHRVGNADAARLIVERHSRPDLTAHRVDRVATVR